MKFHIMSEWKTYKLGDLIECIIDNRGKSAPISISNYQPIIEINALGQREVNYDVIRKYVSKETYDTWFRAGHPKIGDILFSTVGTIGLTSLMTQDVGCIAQNIIALRANDKLLNNLYLYYFLNNKTTKINLNNLNIGGVQPSIKLPHLLNMPISLPPLAEQKRIADILSAIDDKIELNRRINANLEQQAQALYKSWFVDFEPFGGKMPEDWREGTLGEIAEFRRGKGILGKDTIKGNIPVVAGGLEPAYYHNLANTKAPVVTISASGANAGFMRMYNVDVWASDCSYIDSRCANLLWTYCYLKINAQLLKHAQTGAVQPHVKASDVNAFEIIIPSSENILNFQQKVKPIFDQIANNERENIHLAQLRDTLLPKLMSGEITV